MIDTGACTRDSGRALLRQATSGHHQTVDALFSRYDLSSPDGYRRFLLAQAGAFLPVEAALDRADPGRFIADWPARRRSQALVQDLQALGAAPPPPQTSPPFVDDGAILGGLYVLEGARLGGAVLKRRLPSTAPCRFLDAPSHPGAWRNLVARLDDDLASSARLTAAIDAARAVFKLFEESARAYA